MVITSKGKLDLILPPSCPHDGRGEFSELPTFLQVFPAFVDGALPLLQKTCVLNHKHKQPKTMQRVSVNSSNLRSVKA